MYPRDCWAGCRRGLSWTKNTYCKHNSVDLPEPLPPTSARISRPATSSEHLEHQLLSLCGSRKQPTALNSSSSELSTTVDAWFDAELRRTRASGEKGRLLGVHQVSRAVRGKYGYLPVLNMTNVVGGNKHGNVELARYAL